MPNRVRHDAPPSTSPNATSRLLSDRPPTPGQPHGLHRLTWALGRARRDAPGTHWPAWPHGLSLAVDCLTIL